MEIIGFTIFYIFIIVTGAKRVIAVFRHDEDNPRPEKRKAYQYLLDAILIASALYFFCVYTNYYLKAVKKFTGLNVFDLF